MALRPHYNHSGSDSCSSNGNSTFLAPGSGSNRIQKHTEFPGGQARESGAALPMLIRHMPRVRPKLRYSQLQRRKAEKICCSFFQGRPTKPDIGPEDNKSLPLCENKNVAQASALNLPPAAVRNKVRLQHMSALDLACSCLHVRNGDRVWLRRNKFDEERAGVTPHCRSCLTSLI